MDQGGGRGVRVMIGLAVLLGAAPCWATDIPRYVQGPASGLQYDCRQAGQRVPALETLVTTTADLDGDGKPEHIIDAGKGCEAVRALYCNAAGCSVDIYVTSRSGSAGGFKARRATVDRGTRPARLVLTTGGGDCGKPAEQECSITLRWTGSALERVE